MEENFQRYEKLTHKPAFKNGSFNMTNILQGDNSRGTNDAKFKTPNKKEQMARIESKISKISHLLDESVKFY